MAPSDGSARRMRWTTSIAVAAAIGGGVFLVVWNAKTFRLEVDGASVLWVALVAFGAVWPMGERWSRAATGLGVGMVAGVAAFYGAAVVLPLTPMGRGIGLGVAAAAVSAACLSARRFMALGTAMIGYGIGAGVAVFAGIRPTSGIGDLFEVWMALGVAGFAGVFGARLLRASVVELRRRQIVHASKIHVAGAPRPHKMEEKAQAPILHLPHIRMPAVHMPHRRHREHDGDAVAWDDDRRAAPEMKRAGEWP